LTFIKISPLVRMHTRGEQDTVHDD